jgi:hypothetical protein
MSVKNALITQTEFRRRTGMTASRLRQLKAEGFPLVGKRVDYEKAIAWVETNVDQARKDQWQSPSLNDLRRRREQLKIEAQQIELEKARGQLIEREAVKRFISERGRLERDSWLAWVSAVSARLAASLGLDHRRLSGTLDAEVRMQLRHLADKPIDFIR